MKSLRTLLSSGCLPVPGVYDCVSAKLAEAAGFEALELSGSSVSAATLGLPDLGFLNLSDITKVAERVVASVSVPVICDADTGYGGVNQVWETVRRLEHAGVAAIHIEDQESPKKCGCMAGRPVVSESEMVTKIQSAVAARQSDDFFIIGRTDAKETEGMSGVLRRLGAYVAAGADVVYAAEEYSADEMRTLAGDIKGCLAVSGDTPTSVTDFTPPEKYAQWGVGMVIYWFSSLYSAAKGMRDFHEQMVRDNGIAAAVASQSLMNFSDFQTLMDLDTWEGRERSRSVNRCIS